MENTNKDFAEFRQYVNKNRQKIEKGLKENLPDSPTHIENEFNEAMDFILSSKKDKIRSVLTLLGAELFNGKVEDVLPAAIASEYVYNSSLIFQGLPFFSNDRKTSNKESFSDKFGEGVAVLAGIGLLNASYPLVFVNHSGMPERAMQAHSEIVECVGATGLVGGKTLALSEKDSEKEEIKNESISALLRLSLRLGAILSGANYIELSELTRFAELIGDAYQINEEVTGKNEKGDLEFDESSESNRLQMLNTIDEAKRVLVENFPSNQARTCLIQFGDSLAQ